MELPMKAVPARGIAATLTLLALPLAAQQPTGRAFQLSDWYRVAQLSTPTLSPDGNTVAFTVTTVRESEDKRHSEVWVQATSGGAARRMTSPGFESSAPRWSDDGKLLSFTSTRPGGGRGTNWAVRMDEGGEAFQPEATRPAPAATGAQPADKSFSITSGENGGAGGRGGRGAGGGGRGGGAPLADSAATPNGTGPYGKMLPMARPPVNSITKPVDPARFDGRHITDEAYRSNDGGFRPSTGRGGRGAGGPGGGRGGAAAAGAARHSSISSATAPTGRHSPAPATRIARRASRPTASGSVFAADARLRSDSVVAHERDSLAKLPPVTGHDPVERNDAGIFALPIAACEAQSADCKPRHVEYIVGTASDLNWSPESAEAAGVRRQGRGKRFKSSRLYVVAADGGKPTRIFSAAGSTSRGTSSGGAAARSGWITSTGGASRSLPDRPRERSEITPILGGRREITDIPVRQGLAHTKIVYLAT